MSFSGFSEDDIRRLTKGSDVNKPQKGAHKPSKKVTFKSNNNTINGSRPKTILNNITNNIPNQELPENAKLSVFHKNENITKHSQNQNMERKHEKTKPNNIPDVPASTNSHSTQHTGEKVIEPIKELSQSSEKKFKDLDEFEAKQKLIEEQNRKRKELLAKALADRTRQTQEEAKKLSDIQDEFKKLDVMLSGDVKILRKQIELASIEYMECQKRYQKIEKEFLEAKLLLHQKQEKKEMLTEHLCTIIEKNEERKAEKLNELLLKLQLPPPENDIEKTNGNNEVGLDPAN